MRLGRRTRVSLIMLACALVTAVCTRNSEPSPTPKVFDGVAGTTPAVSSTQKTTIVATPSADDHVAAAWLLFERGEYRDAIDEARRAAMVDPDSAAALHARGYLTYIVDGAREAALSDLRKARERDPDNPGIVLDLLRVQVGTMTGSGVHELTDAAVEAGALPFELMIVVSRYRSLEGNRHNAADIANEALGYASSAEQRNKALELRAWYEIQQGLVSDGLVTYQQIDDGAPAPTAEMGELLAVWLSGARDQVRDAMEDVLIPYPLSSDPASSIEVRIEPVLAELTERVRTELQEDVLERAEAAWDESGYEAAIAVIEDSFRGASLPPQTAEEFWNVRGGIYMESGRFELAAAAYSEVLEYNPSDPSAHAGRAAAYLELQMYEEALDDAVRRPSFSGPPPPDRPDLKRLENAAILGCEVEAQAYYGLGNPPSGDSAFAACANLAALVSRRAEILATTARTQLEYRNPSGALSTAEQAIESVDGASIEAVYGACGAALVALGQFDEAVAAYERATRPIDYGDRVDVGRPYVERLALLELMGDELAAEKYARMVENIEDYLPDRLPADYALELIASYRSDMESWYEVGLAAQAGGG